MHRRQLHVLKALCRLTRSALHCIESITATIVEKGRTITVLPKNGLQSITVIDAELLSLEHVTLE